MQKTVTIRKYRVSGISVMDDNQDVSGGFMSNRTKSHPGERESGNPLKPATNFGKGAWKKVIDLALYLTACALTGTGLLLAYRLPHGQGYAGRMLLLGYDRHEWGEIHTWLAY